MLYENEVEILDDDFLLQLKPLTVLTFSKSLKEDIPAQEKKKYQTLRLTSPQSLMENGDNVRIIGKVSIY